MYLLDYGDHLSRLNETENRLYPINNKYHGLIKYINIIIAIKFQGAIHCWTVYSKVDNSICTTNTYKCSENSIFLNIQWKIFVIQ